MIIDPVLEPHERDLALVREQGIGLSASLLASLDTHCRTAPVIGSRLPPEATGCAIGLCAIARARNVTLPLADGERVSFGVRHLEVRPTPGHTDSCLTCVPTTTTRPSPKPRCWCGAAVAAISSRATPPPSCAR